VLSCSASASQCWICPLERRLSNARWPSPAGAPPSRLPGQAEVHQLLLCTRLLKMREPGSMGGLLLVNTIFRFIPNLQTYLTGCTDQRS